MPRTVLGLTGRAREGGAGVPLASSTPGLSPLTPVAARWVSPVHRYTGLRRWCTLTHTRQWKTRAWAWVLGADSCLCSLASSSLVLGPRGAQLRLVTHTGVTSVEYKLEPAALTPTISCLGGADHPGSPSGRWEEAAMAWVTRPSHVPLIQASALAASPHAGCIVPNGITACQTKQQDS